MRRGFRSAAFSPPVCPAVSLHLTKPRVTLLHEERFEPGRGSCRRYLERSEGEHGFVRSGLARAEQPCTREGFAFELQIVEHHVAQLGVSCGLLVTAGE